MSGFLKMQSLLLLCCGVFSRYVSHTLLLSRWQPNSGIVCCSVAAYIKHACTQLCSFWQFSSWKLAREFCAPILLIQVGKDNFLENCRSWLSPDDKHCLKSCFLKLVESGVQLSIATKAYSQMRVSWVDSPQHSEVSSRVSLEAFLLVVWLLSCPCTVS